MMITFLSAFLACLCDDHIDSGLVFLSVYERHGFLSFRRKTASKCLGSLGER